MESLCSGAMMMMMMMMMMLKSQEPASQPAYHKQSMSYNNNNNKPENIRSTAGSPACLQLAFGQASSRKQNRNIHKRFSVP